MASTLLPCFLYACADLDRQITLEKSKMKGVSEGRTMLSVRSEVQEKDELVIGLSRKVEQKREKLMDNQKKLSELEREVNNLNSQMVWFWLLSYLSRRNLYTYVFELKHKRRHSTFCSYMISTTMPHRIKDIKSSLLL